MTGIKDALRSLTPPILWQAARRVKSRFEAPLFEGPFPSWEAAVSRSDGWDSPSITAKTLDAALKVRDGLFEFEMDGLPRKRIIYSPTILAFLLLALSRQKSAINIIDFGGGLGSNYFQNRKILRGLTATPVCWSVVERPIFAELGVKHFQNFQTAELRFFSTLEDALSSVTPIPDAIIFTGSLQNIADPFPLLEKVVKADINLIALDRLLVSPTKEHAAFVQHPDPKVFYPATYPVWCFSKDVFVAWMVAKGFTLVEHFTSDPDALFDHCGLIFVR